MSETEVSAEAPGPRGAWGHRLALAGAAVAGAAAVAVAWLVLGGSNGQSSASFQVSAGIPPVLFVYLDDVHIASYLAQLQGGAATTESLSQESTSSKNASVSADGAGVGASSSHTSGAELALTVTDQSRFTSLLGLLQANGYLHTIDMAAPDRVVKREFSEVTPGSFVKLSECTLALPRYVQDEQVWRAAKGTLSVQAVLGSGGRSSQEQITTGEAKRDRAIARGKKPPGLSATGTPLLPIPPKLLAVARSQMNHLVRHVGTNPRVPLSSCSPRGYDPNVPDLLMPIRLGTLSSNQSALAGRVTLVGKVVLSVGRRGDPYLDRASLQQWSGADFWTYDRNDPENLPGDATVLGPGYVIQPIAIYK